MAPYQYPTSSTNICPHWGCGSKNGIPAPEDRQLHTPPESRHPVGTSCAQTALFLPLRCTLGNFMDESIENFRERPGRHERQMVDSKAFPRTVGLSPSSLPEIISPPAGTKVTASLGALRAQISIPGMKVKAMQGAVAVHSFSHSSSSWTIETFMCEVFPFSFSHFIPVSFV